MRVQKFVRKSEAEVDGKDCGTSWDISRRRIEEKLNYCAWNFHIFHIILQNELWITHPPSQLLGKPYLGVVHPGRK